MSRISLLPHIIEFFFLIYNWQVNPYQNTVVKHIETKLKMFWSLS